MSATASLVLYKNDINEVNKSINCLITYGVEIIFIIDNSDTDILKKCCSHHNIIYFHNPSNPGFGAAHNIAISKAIEAGIEYHFIVNPDIFFKEDVINPMLTFIQKNKNIGMLMPQILNLNGSIQYLPKLMPTPWGICLRKLKRPKNLYLNFINNYELRFVEEDKIYSSPIVSGCFTLLNLNIIREVGLFDEKYFMYFEDWDLSRRINQKYKSVYFPRVSVYHRHESGANKSVKLFIIFLKSAIRYFNKWGWFNDKERKIINKTTLDQFVE